MLTAPLSASIFAAPTKDSSCAAFTICWKSALQRKASDLVIKADAKPALRVNGKMQFADSPAISAAQARELIYEILFSANRDRMIDLDALDEIHEDDSEAQLKTLEEKREIDLVFTIPTMARVRANLFMERGRIGAVLRIIPLRPYTIEELGLPPILKKMALEPQGLIIITGPTGSGKTSTLAAIIEEINRNKNANIFTVEEPVEYLFEDKQSVIHQREVGADTHSFESALHSVTRQSPDVIAIGELRDRKADGRGDDGGGDRASGHHHAAYHIRRRHD